MSLAILRPGARTARVLLLGLVLAAAVFLRTYSLDTVPPGLYHDEAVNGLDILDVLNGHFPIFFERNNGREPLFIYAQAMSVYLLGENAVALRLVAVAFGLLTVWATYLLANEWFGFRVGLLSAAGIAVSFWHVNLSRIGLRSIALPFFLLLTLYFLWRALKSERRTHFIMAGVIGGLGLYTYISARLIPLLLLLILVVHYSANRDRLLAQWRGIVLMVAVAMVIGLPIMSYYATHPDSFFARMGQVSILSETPDVEGRPRTLEQSVLGAGEMFFISGDQNWRHNLAGRPVFTPVAGALFAVGFFWVLLNVRRSSNETFLMVQASTVQVLTRCGCRNVLPG